MEKTNHLDWALFGVRLIVGITFIVHGGQRILDHFGYGLFGSQIHAPHGSLFCFAPLTEVFGGGLILGGILIEVGTLLVIPAILILLFLTNLKSGYFFSPENFRYTLNLIMLLIVIGICGPGKWALWDPGKYLRKKFLRVED